MKYIYKKINRDCSKCIRLKKFIDDNRVSYPDFFNAPVPSFGSDSPRLLIVGLAPGLKGANQNGIPFTGDYAGDLLYPTLIKYGWAEGEYKINKGDNGLKLTNSRITNAVLCVPPENKPLSEEINNCREFLKCELGNPSIDIVLTLGLVAHQSVIKSLEKKLSDYKFSHGAIHKIGEKIIINSYHCSRYNTNTKRLTEDMFENIFKIIKKEAGFPKKR